MAASRMERLPIRAPQRYEVLQHLTIAALELSDDVSSALLAHPRPPSTLAIQRTRNEAARRAALPSLPCAGTVSLLEAPLHSRAPLSFALGLAVVAAMRERGMRGPPTLILPPRGKGQAKKGAAEGGSSEGARVCGLTLEPARSRTRVLVRVGPTATAGRAGHGPATLQRKAAESAGPTFFPCTSHGGVPPVPPQYAIRGYYSALSLPTAEPKTCA
jgi:hypothetical protein